MIKGIALWVECIAGSTAEDFGVGLCYVTGLVMDAGGIGGVGVLDGMVLMIVGLVIACYVVWSISYQRLGCGGSGSGRI
jgi:hypothetical protein